LQRLLHPRIAQLDAVHLAQLLVKVQRVYRQEFRASFENLTSGRVYYAFDRTDIQPVEYDPRFPLCWSLDFNIDPACSVLCQLTYART
jgi:hypothetical protein